MPTTNSKIDWYGDLGGEIALEVRREATDMAVYQSEYAIRISASGETVEELLDILNDTLAQSAAMLEGLVEAEVEEPEDGVDDEGDTE